MLEFSSFPHVKNKGIVEPKCCCFTYFLPTTMSVEALVTCPNLEFHGIPSNGSTMEVYGSHVLKHYKACLHKCLPCLLAGGTFR